MILLRCYRKAFFAKKFPEKVILEMGADAPGDIKYLSRLFRPEKGVIICVLPVHMSSFKNIEAVATEKKSLAQNIRKNGRVFLNIDDPRVADTFVPANVKKVTFGTKPGADFRAVDIKSDLTGLSFRLIEGKSEINFKIRLYGEQLIYSILAAIAVARSEHISYSKIKSILKEMHPVRGRMNVIEGIKSSLIIDDSYNANPTSVTKALDFLGSQNGRRIALLGNMNELGQYEREGHERVGEAVAKKADILLTVGDVASRHIVAGAISGGLKKQFIHSFDDASKAGEYLAGELKKGDVVLVKGSQNKVRLERAIEHFMAHPEDKNKILVRQSAFWQDQE
jgi:UDP-N-acetylmuramoyl-tripeptide--D-alanyl-D-alanine ligase